MSDYPMPPRNQRGAALVTGLLIMMVMTLIGLAAMQSSIIQTNLATNAQLNTISYQTAEAVLTDAASFNYLSKSLKEANGINLPAGTEIVTLDSALETSAAKSGKTGGQVRVATTGQVTFCGTLPPALATGLSLDADQSASNNTYTRYVFDLTATTKIENNGNVQAVAQHSQRSTRLMLSQQGGVAECNI